jgi:transmembrane sensor
VNRNFTNMTDDLLVKYLLGEVTKEEIELVDGWIALNDANRKHFEHFKLIWQESKKLEAVSIVNVDEAWERFQNRTNAAQAAPAKVIEFRPASRWQSVAAVLLVLVCCSWFVYYFVMNRGNEMIAIEAGNTPVIDTLPDGSVITLNKHSSLSYASNFDGKTRDVKLTGEAFFNVAPDKTKPFIISTNDVKVQVVGTSFNVKSDAKKTEVIVETGIVKVAKNHNDVTLKPNEKATVYFNASQPIKEMNDDVLYNYYRTKEFVCNATPLWRLADVLNEAYGVDINIPNERLRQMPITTTFRNEPIDNILAVISETFNVRVERNGNNITLR